MVECTWDENGYKSKADCSERRKHIVTAEEDDGSKRSSGGRELLVRWLVKNKV